jgi:hypothetical protein
VGVSFQKSETEAHVMVSPVEPCARWDKGCLCWCKCLAEKHGVKAFAHSWFDGAHHDRPARAMENGVGWEMQVSRLYESRIMENIYFLSLDSYSPGSY